MPRTATPAIPGVEVTTPAPAGCEPILSGDALRFVASLARRFEPTRRDLLARRAARLQELEAGRLPDFLPETRALRERDWTVAPIPPDLQERKVEITGPVDKDGHQRPQLGGERVHGRLRGLALPDLGEHHPGSASPRSRP